MSSYIQLHTFPSFNSYVISGKNHTSVNEMENLKEKKNPNLFSEGRNSNRLNYFLIVRTEILNRKNIIDTLVL